MRNRARRAARLALVTAGYLAAVAAVLVAVAAVYQLPGGRALCGAVLGLALGAFAWYWITVSREARGGHFMWPGNVNDRWKKES